MALWREGGIPKIWPKGKSLTSVVPPDWLSRRTTSSISIPSKNIFGADAGSELPIGPSTEGIEAGFNLADSIGSGLIGAGGIKLFSQALGELFGKRKKKETPMTFEDIYRSKVAKIPKRKSYLEEALGE